MSVYVLEMPDPIFNSFWMFGFLREAVDIHFHLNFLHFMIMENHDVDVINGFHTNEGSD